jgi:hypothetical protein
MVHFTAVISTVKMIKRNWQCNEQCSLCDQERETAEQLLCLLCPYAKEVWCLVASLSGNLITVPQATGGLENW